MDHLLKTCIRKLSFPLSFVKQYVDDLILALPWDGIDEILNTFNNYNNHIKFTVEKEQNNAVPFLDA